MKNSGILNGILAGVVAIILTLVFYFVDKSIVVSWGGWTVILIYIFFMYKAGKEARDQNGGFISFGNVLLPIFLTYGIGTLLASIFSYVLYNYIDSSLLDIQLDKAIEAMDKMRGFMGDEAADTAIEQLEEDGISFGPGKVFLGWLWGLFLPGIIIALIMAAIMKKNDPELEKLV